MVTDPKCNDGAGTGVLVVQVAILAILVPWIQN